MLNYGIIRDNPCFIRGKLGIVPWFQGGIEVATDKCSRNTIEMILCRYDIVQRDSNCGKIASLDGASSAHRCTVG